MPFDVVAYCGYSLGLAPGKVKVLDLTRIGFNRSLFDPRPRLRMVVAAEAATTPTLGYGQTKMALIHIRADRSCREWRGLRW